MGQAGHRVIVAEQDWRHLFSLSRFSRYVNKFVLLPNDISYEDALVQLWENENIDCFLPVSHIHLAIEDTKAKAKMQVRARKNERPFCDLAINDPELVEELDNKLKFMQRCQNLGLNVPDYRTFSGSEQVLT